MFDSFAQKRTNTIKMSDASVEKVVLLKQKKALLDMQNRLTDAMIKTTTVMDRDLLLRQAS